MGKRVARQKYETNENRNYNNKMSDEDAVMTVLLEEDTYAEQEMNSHYNETVVDAELVEASSWGDDENDDDSWDDDEDAIEIGGASEEYEEPPVTMDTVGTVAPEHEKMIPEEDEKPAPPSPAPVHDNSTNRYSESNYTRESASNNNSSSDRDSGHHDVTSSLQNALTEMILRLGLEDHLVLVNADHVVRGASAVEQPVKLNDIRLDGDFKSVSEVLQAFAGLENCEYVRKDNGRWTAWNGIDRRNAENIAQYYIRNYDREDLLTQATSKYICEDRPIVMDAWLEQKNEKAMKTVVKNVNIMLNQLYGRQNGRNVAEAEYDSNKHCVIIRYFDRSAEHYDDKGSVSEKMSGILKAFEKLKTDHDMSVRKEQSRRYEELTGHSAHQDDIPEKDNVMLEWQNR